MQIKNNISHTLKQNKLNSTEESKDKSKLSSPQGEIKTKELGQQGALSNLRVKQAMEEAVTHDPDRDIRINELRDQVKKGTYQVDVDKLAQNLLQRSVDEDL